MPLIRKEKLCDGLMLGLWRIDETLQELISHLYLNKEEFEMLETYKNELRQKQWLSYRVLIRSMLQKDMIYKIYYNKQGKPLLVQPPHDISVTHSGKYAAILIAEPNKYRLGIDLEHVNLKILRIRERFLNPIERIRASINPIPATYVQLWSAKEAVYKCLDNPDISLRHNMFVHSIRAEDNQNMKFIIKVKTYSEMSSFENFVVKSEYVEDYVLSFTYKVIM